VTKIVSFHHAEIRLYSDCIVSIHYDGVSLVEAQEVGSYQTHSVDEEHD